MAQSIGLPPPITTTNSILFCLIISAHASTSVTSGFGETSPYDATSIPSDSSIIFLASPLLKKNGLATRIPFLQPRDDAIFFISFTRPFPKCISTGWI